MSRVPCVVIGTGNIGTDLMHKLMRSEVLDLLCMIGVDEASDGVARARKAGIPVSTAGTDWLRTADEDVQIAFDATSARVHQQNAPLLRERGIFAIDLTPAAVGPAVVPTVNLREHMDEPNVNMITCGGQATTPIVAAVSRVTPVPYAEMISTISSRSAGPGTRANIDEFTKTTARGLEVIGGAEIGKAIIILNPADPPILMRNTVHCGIAAGVDHDAIIASVEQMVAEVATYVKGYRLKSAPLFDEGPFATPAGPVMERVSILLEVEGAGDYLPPYAGNLDIMTAAAVRVGEAVAQERLMQVTR
jgi:acetaldehyde dehydrogenase